MDLSNALVALAARPAGGHLVRHGCDGRLHLLGRAVGVTISTCCVPRATQVSPHTGQSTTESTVGPPPGLARGAPRRPRRRRDMSVHLSSAASSSRLAVAPCRCRSVAGPSSGRSGWQRCSVAARLTDVGATRADSRADRQGERRRRPSARGRFGRPTPVLRLARLPCVSSNHERRPSYERPSASRRPSRHSTYSPSRDRLRGQVPQRRRDA
jgi:hypothetical protein